MKQENLTKIAHAVRIAECKRMLKLAQESADIDYVARRRKLKLILGALLGAYAGGVAGGTAKGGAGALAGVGIGSLAGLGAAHLSNKVRDYAGLDPMGQVVTVGKA